MASEVTRPLAHEADFTFRVGELPVEELKVTGFWGTEGLSELYHFTLDFCSDNAAVEFDAVVGQRCVLRIQSAEGSRYVNGIVRRFARTGEANRLTYYRAEIVPLHWLLTKRIRSRIYQAHNCPDMTVPGIIKKVFETAGIPEDAYRLALEGSYAAREYVVQYRESDLDFISRLMEHEGIFYFFEHTADGHVMVIGDSGVAHTVSELNAETPFREPVGLVPEQDREVVFGLRDAQEIQIGAVCLEDYDFKRPALELRSEIKGEKNTSLEFSDFPGEYIEKSIGQQYARVRLEEFAAGRQVIEMDATTRGLTPGHKFSLIEHPVEALNREYLITHVTHRGRQPQSAAEEAAGAPGLQYEANLRTIPSEVPYRPPRKTPKPVILGSQTALVTGPDGEEIYTDEYGRVKVQFHWDLEGEHDENSSCFVRVSQNFAGGQYGMQFLPRVGQEVIVSFLEGNPDQPIITGRVYNADNKPPYGPDDKTKSTIKTRSSPGGGGFNELRFDDKKDNEQVFLHAQRNLDVRAKNNKYETIEKDSHRIVQGNAKAKVDGDDHFKAGGNQMIDIGGNQSLSVGGNQAVSAGGNFELQAGGNATIIATGNLAIQASGVLSIKAATIILDASAVITLTAGGAGVVAVTPAAVATGPVTAVGMGPGNVAPVPASGVAPPGVPAPPAIAMGPTPPSDPEEAATGDPGQDFTYEQERREIDPIEDGPLHNEEDATEEQTHWIGIRLWDDNGQPLVGERYALVLPDGTRVARGRLDQNGEAEIRGIDPGSCEVTFPDLDGPTWEAGPAAGGEGGDGAPVA